MNRNNNAGLPYSDELYHYGIVGQKWGVRRFQNADRTWTAAGKERYGSGKVKEVGEKVANEAKKIAKAFGNASKKAAKYAVKRFKMKHPSLMSDEEIIELKRRMDLERSYKEAKRDLKRNDFSTRTWNAIQDITRRSVTKLGEATAQKASEELAKRLFEDKSEREKRKYENMIAAEKAKWNWENQDYLKDKSSDKSKTDKKQVKHQDDKKSDNEKSDNEKPQKKATEIVDEMNAKREQERLERNKEEAKKEAQRLIEQREKNDEEKRKQRQRLAANDYWYDYANNNPGGYWSQFR